MALSRDLPIQGRQLHLPLASVVTSVNLLKFSNPWFPHRYNGDVNTYLTGFLCVCVKIKEKYICKIFSLVPGIWLMFKNFI